MTQCGMISVTVTFVLIIIIIDITHLRVIHDNEYYQDYTDRRILVRDFMYRNAFGSGFVENVTRERSIPG